MARRLRQPPESAAASVFRSTKPARPEELTQPAFALVLRNMGGGERLFKHLPDGQARCKARILRDIRGASPFAHGQFTGIGFNLPGQDREQSGLAGAVRADEADPGAILDGERNASKQGSSAKLLGDGLCIQDRGHRLLLEYRQRG